MRTLFFSIILVGIISVYETLASLFFGFYLLGAGVNLFIIFRWKFSVQSVQYAVAFGASTLVQLIGAIVFVGQMIAWQYGMHIVCYEILVGICIYEITKKEKLLFK